MAERKAEVLWEGNLIGGQGTITKTGSGALGSLPISWRARTENSEGYTSPEELLAAAQAACFAMALSGTLARAGHEPQDVRAEAVCTFEKKADGGWKVGSMNIAVFGRVPGIAEAEFERLAQETAQTCPISGAIRGNVAIEVKAHLAK